MYEEFFHFMQLDKSEKCVGLKNSLKLWNPMRKTFHFKRKNYVPDCAFCAYSHTYCHNCSCWLLTSKEKNPSNGWNSATPRILSVILRYDDNVNWRIYLASAYQWLSNVWRIFFSKLAFHHRLMVRFWKCFKSLISKRTTDYRALLQRQKFYLCFELEYLKLSSL